MGTHGGGEGVGVEAGGGDVVALLVPGPAVVLGGGLDHGDGGEAGEGALAGVSAVRLQPIDVVADPVTALLDAARSEEHTSELQSLMRISYAVFCLKKTIKTAPQSATKHPNTQHYTT